MPRVEGIWIVDESEERFDRVMEWLLIGLLAFMPLAFGVVEAWSEEVVVALAAAISICFCLKIALTRNPRMTWTWAYLPVLAFILVAVVQTIPLPVALVRLVSPQTVVQKLQLLGELNRPEGLPSTVTISFYTYATRHDLRLLLALAAIFVVVLNTIRRPDQITRLLTAVTVIGALVALETILQAVFGNGKIYWFVPTPHDTALSGPFVNHSHFAQFMNLSIGATLALIFVRIQQRFAGHPVTPPIIAEYFGSREGRFLIGLLLVVAIGAASIFVSLSRGGMISMMIAGGFTTLIISSRRSLKGSGWIMALLALAAFVCILYVGFDAVYDRLGTLGELGQAEGGRWQVVKDIAIAWTRFPVTGTGLGTHEVVYPMFDRSTVAALASHAENEYAQTAEETGIVGLIGLIIFGVIVWRCCARTLWTPYVPIHSAAYGLGFGLTAIMVHSLSDFGQHLPANAFLSVIFCALLIRLRHIPTNDDAGVAEVVFDGGVVRRYGVVGLVVVCIVWAWALLDADAARRGAMHWRRALAVEADLMRRDWQVGPEEYIPLISHAQAAADIEPGNVTYRYWLPVYRWRAISRGADPNAAEILLSPEGREFATRIVAELNEACACCPTFGATWSVLGQLERLVLNREEGEEHIQTGYMLAPCNPTACLVAGSLDAEAGRLEQAFAKLQRAVRLDPGCYSEVARLLIDDLQRPDLALEIAGEHPSLAGQLAHMLEDDTEFAKEVDGKLLDLLEQKCREDDASAYWHAMLAEVQRRRANPKTAIACYRKALTMNYGQVQWHLRLAQLLAEQGLIADAIHEAKVCLQLSPGIRAAERLLQSLSTAQPPQGSGH